MFEKIYLLIGGGFPALSLIAVALLLFHFTRLHLIEIKETLIDLKTSVANLGKRVGEVESRQDILENNLNHFQNALKELQDDMKKLLLNGHHQKVLKSKYSKKLPKK